MYLMYIIITNAKLLQRVWNSKNASRDHSFSAYATFLYWYAHTQNFRKTNISYQLIRRRSCAYQWVRNVSFSKILRTYYMNDPLAHFLPMLSLSVHFQLFCSTYCIISHQETLKQKANIGMKWVKSRIFTLIILTI